MKMKQNLLIASLLTLCFNGYSKQTTDSVSTVYDPLTQNFDKTRIFQWAISRKEVGYGSVSYSYYEHYLNSLNTRYTLFVPTDSYYETTIDPIAFGQIAPQGGFQFKFNPTINTVYAVAKTFDKSAKPWTFSDSVKVITDEAFLQNRLIKMLENHLVEGDLTTNKTFYVTKSNDFIKVTGTGMDVTLAGGFELESGKPCTTKQVFNQTNGTTYFMDKPLQPVLRSVYKTLSETPAFSGFYNLLTGIPDTCIQQIFYRQGVDTAVTMFHAFRYTVYVPTNAVLQNAIDQGRIKTWATISAITNNSEKALEINKLIRFLKYHFQDEAVFFGQASDGIYLSSTLKNDMAPSHFQSGKNRFYKIGVKADANSMTLTTETNQTVHVVTSEGLYNIIAKDYQFSQPPSYYKNIDGSGPVTGSTFLGSSIVSSSSAVIHQIDQVLMFQ